MSVVAGEIRMCGFGFAPEGWLMCQGQTLWSMEFPELYQVIGTTFGEGEAGSFRLPDLQDRAPVHAGTAPDGNTYQLGDAGGTAAVTLNASQIPAHGHALPASTAAGTNVSPEGGAYAASQAQQYTPLGSDLSAAWLKPWGGNQPHENRMPFLTLNYIIATRNDDGMAEGSTDFGSPLSTDATSAAAPFTLPGQLGYFASTRVPDGWIPCDGPEGSVPDLRGRFVLGSGDGYPLGQSAGEATHVLTMDEIPKHFHDVAACGAAADAGTPVGNYPARYDEPRGPLYGPDVDTSLPLSSIAGGGQAHDNMPPFLALNVCADPGGTLRQECFLGEIRCTSATWESSSWLPCDGRAVSMQTAPALYSLLGDLYGFSGAQFLLPNLVGAVAYGLGIDEKPGKRGGAATVPLGSGELPAHAHAARVSTESDQRQDAPAPDTYPTVVANRGGNLQLYATPEQQAQSEVLMLHSEVAGGSAAHNNMAPYTALNVYICINGSYPIRTA